MILDIGSGSVGAALVSLGEGHKPKVVYSVREDILFQDEFKFDRFLSSMLKTTESVLGKLQKKSSVKVKNMYCVLSAPWYVSRAKIVGIKSAKPVVFTKKKIDDLIKKEIDGIKKDFDTRYKDLTKFGAEIIEVENIFMKLNGYATNDPFGKSAESFEAHLYISMSSQQVIKAIKEKVNKTFAVRNLMFHSFSLSAFSTLRDMYSNLNDFTFMDISGEMTEMSVVRQGALIETVSFSLGKNFILRAIASHLGTVSDDALSSFALHMDEKMSGESKKKMVSTLEFVQKEWLDAFRKNLISLSARTVLPGKIFIITDTPFGQWFSGVLKEGNYSKVSLMGDTFDAEVINPKVLAKFVQFDLNVTRDSFIIIESLFVHRLLNFSGG